MQRAQKPLDKPSVLPRPARRPSAVRRRAKAGEPGIRFADVTVAPDAADPAQLVALAARGQVRAAVEQTLPLAGMAKAQELSEAGRVKGKIVLLP
ncbi:hypothetical protein AV521_42785 [Streptomyces sp. IMTB 2501]|uniref:zinc-binding dehydrogenase n=1 Tax=Streptomyces sp. IMTB 2501 TaxID=1776340 RepID=UPI00097A075B|nr:zinc-binding dehydrogenase [Streptomyces sp. IMTB 2501]OLZ62145.1 hypothetical protein AV521_42785 [Streptomyces sp. IMTB 2501]